MKKYAFLLLLLVFPLALSAQGWKELFNGRSLDGWKSLRPDNPNEWVIASGVQLDPSEPKLFRIAASSPGGKGGIMVNGAKGRTVNLITAAEHGDVEAEVEFVVPKGSNSGVYFQGLYEIQILDSYGKAKDELLFSDCGGIYARWINEKSVGGEPPRVNASRAPGEWQSFHVWFRAPRFDASGKKIENARFVKVVHNGVVVHENFELDGPTRAHMDKPEAATGPLMVQGDHGPVAFRKVRIRALMAANKRESGPSTRMDDAGTIGSQVKDLPNSANRWLKPSTQESPLKRADSHCQALTSPKGLACNFASLLKQAKTWQDLPGERILQVAQAAVYR